MQKYAKNCKIPMSFLESACSETSTHVIFRNVIPLKKIMLKHEVPKPGHTQQLFHLTFSA